MAAALRRTGEGWAWGSRFPGKGGILSFFEKGKIKKERNGGRKEGQQRLLDSMLCSSTFLQGSARPPPRASTWGLWSLLQPPSG